jgi:hypothetical protein
MRVGATSALGAQEHHNGSTRRSATQSLFRWGAAQRPRCSPANPRSPAEPRQAGTVRSHRGRLHRPGERHGREGIRRSAPDSFRPGRRSVLARCSTRMSRSRGGGCSTGSRSSTQRRPRFRLSLGMSGRARGSRSRARSPAEARYSRVPSRLRRPALRAWARSARFGPRSGRRTRNLRMPSRVVSDTSHDWMSPRITVRRSGDRIACPLSLFRRGVAPRLAAVVGLLQLRTKDSRLPRDVGLVATDIADLGDLSFGVCAIGARDGPSRMGQAR